MSFALDELAPAARRDGLAACFIRRCGHLGALGIFALRAAENGLIALLMQQTPPIIGMPGSKRAAIGNNPIAFGCPTADAPIIFDTAMSVVARGNVFKTIERGEQHIPAGWAIDQNGLPTTDPHLALAGAMLPIGGHKGIGLAMLVEIFAGSLAGAASPQSNRQGSASDNGAFLMLVDPAAIGADDFTTHLASWTDGYLAANTAARLPGAAGHLAEMHRSSNGIPISEHFLKQCRAARIDTQALEQEPDRWTDENS